MDVRERVGIAKVAGIALCIAGAALLAFFKGPDFKPSFLKHHPLNPSNETHQTDRVHDRSHMSKWLEGCLFSMSALCAWSLGLVLQVYQTNQSVVGKENYNKNLQNVFNLSRQVL